MVQFQTEWVALQARGIGLVSAETYAHTLVGDTINGGSGIHQSTAVYPKGVQRIGPVFRRKCDSNFSDSFFVKQRTRRFCGRLGGR